MKKYAIHCKYTGLILFNKIFDSSAEAFDYLAQVRPYITISDAFYYFRIDVCDEKPSCAVSCIIAGSGAYAE